MDIQMMTELFEKSRTEKKGLTVYLPGHAIALVVTAVHGTHAVEGRNQQYGTVLVQIDQIIALALP